MRMTLKGQRRCARWLRVGVGAARRAGGGLPPVQHPSAKWACSEPSCEPGPAPCLPADRTRSKRSPSKGRGGDGRTQESGSWGTGLRLSSRAGRPGGFQGGFAEEAAGTPAAELMTRNSDVPEAVCGFGASRCPEEGQRGQEPLSG